MWPKIVFDICFTGFGSCNNVAPVTNLCLGRATTRSHSLQWSKIKLQLKHKNSLFTLQTFHYNYYWWSQSLLNRFGWEGSNNLVQIYRSFVITRNYGRRNFSKYGISYYDAYDGWCKHSRLNRQIWYRHPNSEAGNDVIIR